MIFPDSNSKDYAQVQAWVLAIPVNGCDVINDLAISRSPNGYYVQGRKRPMSWNNAVLCLLK